MIDLNVLFSIINKIYHTKDERIYYNLNYECIITTSFMKMMRLDIPTNDIKIYISGIWYPVFKDNVMYGSYHGMHFRGIG